VVVVPALQATKAGESDSLESVPGLLKSSKIPAQVSRAFACALMRFLSAPARKSIIKVNQNNEYFPLSGWDYQIVEIIAT
jgi:hypothetical protein